jgi:hypothetical protein
MRLQPVRAPDALHRACADTGRLRHHGRGPVRGCGWGIGLRESHHACRNFRSERRNARGACPVAQQALEALLREAFLPAPDRQSKTCVWGALRSRTSASGRRRSDGLTVMEIPVRMRQSRMQEAAPRRRYRSRRCMLTSRTH